MDDSIVDLLHRLRQVLREFDHIRALALKDFLDVFVKSGRLSVHANWDDTETAYRGYI